MITKRQQKYLRALAHHLKPAVSIGQKGLNDAVLAELEHTFGHSELVKVKIRGQDKAQKKDMVTTMLAHSKAELVQMVGGVVSLYRALPEAVIVLPSE